MARNRDPNRQRRHGINEKERQSIRRYSKNKYLYLDNHHFSRRDRLYERAKRPEWPVLDEALFEWHQRLQSLRVPINGEMIREAARELWGRLPQYSEKPLPRFCHWFLDAFKKRHRIRKYKQHGEAASADTAGGEDEMEELRREVDTYTVEDVYNMDETGLFWKSVPDVTLATCPQIGKKKDKERISVAITCSASGKKLPFGNKSRGNVLIEALDMKYRSNIKSWMTGQIMKEYLRWFDSRMRRPSLLILDGFSAHESAAKALEEDKDEPLKWTTVRFLPPNTTAHWQPCDQGIIKNWKQKYRESWLRFLVHKTINDQNPLKSVTLLYAVRWACQAWAEVLPATIRNCWKISTVLGDYFGPQPCRDDDNYNNLVELVDQLEELQVIRRRMDIHNFVDPQDEEIIDGRPEDLMDHLIEMYSPEEEDIDEPDNQPLPTHKEAMEMAERLSIYAGAFDSTFATQIVRINKKIEQQVLADAMLKKKQASIHRYFM
ncbi:DDE-domain-containing protein [Pleomassaria siparia CBS 279.74]|uniref:DDE-domain-containing protein n=1 Tax=Pleomassaria siparia CBS 279.74 TaxID=1314801 RepID=A0A6G1K272_9PLEO|nr:DDE-domain-containing protein [Pleomassaria siparia CBS 279.74]